MRTLKITILIICLLQSAIISAQTSDETDYPFGPVSISFNPLGFVLVGPVLQADIMVAPRISIVPQIRFAGLGALMHAISNFD